MSSKADYLKKYLEPDKKRKKRKVKSKGNLTVRDTDVAWDEIKPAEDDEFAPTIASVVDERPDDLRRKQDGWKAIGDKKKKKKKVERRKRVDSDEEPARRSKRADSSDNDASPGTWIKN